MPRPERRLRLVVLLLCLLAAGLAVILASCPRQPPAASTPAASSPQASPPAAAPRATGVPPAAAPSASAGAASAAAAAPPERPRPKGRLAIVIDDAGYDLAELEPFLRLPIKLSVAVLPNATHSTEAARRVRAAGKELLLHLPMEPDGSENPGPGALMAGMSAAEVADVLDRSLASVPGAVGVNNHMGSKATADMALMRTLFALLAQRGLYWLDSRTTAATVGQEVARETGVPEVERGVFLDAEAGSAAIERALGLAVAEAARDGQSVAIGHVQTSGLVAILGRAPEEMAAAGVAAAGVAELAAEGRVP